MASKGALKNFWKTVREGSSGKNPSAVKGEYVPVYVALGLIIVSVGLATHTSFLHLVYSPDVRVNKKKRETLPEVVQPDKVVDEADRFISKSLFRKMAHVQEQTEPNLPDPILGDVLARNQKERAETLKSAGVETNHV